MLTGAARSWPRENAPFELAPSVWEFADQAESYTRGDQFLLGPDLRVAPLADTPPFDRVG